MNVMGKNSKPSKSNKAETFANDSIRNNTEYTGFLDVITREDETSAKLPNNTNNV